jgi:hypothetical protein
LKPPHVGDAVQSSLPAVDWTQAGVSAIDRGSHRVGVF